MTNSRKWGLLAASGLIATVAVYTWSGESRVSDPEPRQTGRVLLDTLTETVIATGVIRPMVGAEVNVGSRIS